MIRPNLQKISEYALLMLPVALITGPLISEICVIIICLFSIYYSYHKKKYDIFKSKIIVALFIFYIILIISSIYSEFIIFTLKKSIPYLRFILFTVGTYYILNLNPEIKKKFFYVIFISFLVLSIGGIYEFFFKKFCGGYNSITEYEIQNNFFFCSKYLFIGNLLREDRLSSFFGDEMILGSYLSRLFPFLIFLTFINVKNNKQNLLIFSLFFLFIIFTVILTGERTSLFFSILFLIILFFFFKLKLKFKIIFVSIIIFTLTLLTSFNETIKKRIYTQTLNQFYFDNNKLTLFSEQHQGHVVAAYKIFVDHPIIGSGPNTYRKICPRDYSEVGTCTTHPHNLYFQLLSEVGIIGSTIPILFLFILFLYFIKELFFLISKKSNEVNFVKICLCSCFLITLFPLVPSGNFFNNWLSIIYYLPIGFYLNYIKN